MGDVWRCVGGFRLLFGRSSDVSFFPFFCKDLVWRKRTEADRDEQVS